MNVDAFMGYLSEYGLLVLFIIVLLEYMNLPGFPAGIIMPMAGIWMAQGEVNFFTGLIVSVIAGLVGSWILYFVGWYGGDIVIAKYIAKFPSHKKHIDKCMKVLREKEGLGIFLSKLMPVARTLISIPAGVIKVNLKKYTIYSTLGIIVWNTAFIGAGYFLGESALKLFS